MLAKYRPYNELSPFRALEDAFAPFFQAYGEGTVARPWTPPVDVVENENHLVFKADLPDVKPEDVEVTFEKGTLILKGKREFERKEGNGNGGYHRIERSYGSFTRAFSLPETVDPEKLTADYKNGVLTVTIAKKEVAKPKSVKVNVQA
jgi:HSP20 family protein